MDPQEWVERQREEIRRQMRMLRSVADASVRELSGALTHAGLRAEGLADAVPAPVRQVVAWLQAQLAQVESMVQQIGRLAGGQDDLRRALERLDGARRAFEQEVRRQVRSVQRQQVELVQRVATIAARGAGPVRPSTPRAGGLERVPTLERAAPKPKAKASRPAPKPKAAKKGTAKATKAKTTKVAPKAGAKAAPKAGAKAAPKPGAKAAPKAGTSAEPSA
jgi:hypothetical protein